MKPTASPRPRRREDADDDRQAVVAREDGDGHRTGGDHRADGEIEMAGDHQQAHREGDDAEFGGDVEPARGTAGARRNWRRRRSRRTRSTAIRPMSEPISGRRTRLPIDGPKNAGPLARSLHGAVGQELDSSKCPWHERWVAWRGLVGGSGRDVRPDRPGRTSVCGVSGRLRQHQPTSRRHWLASTMPGPVRTGFVGRSRP